MSIYNSNFKTIKNLDYIPVGLNNDTFSKEWLRDNTGENISKKNSYYAEYSFYYWYWKNILKDKKKDDWVGFCSYRKYWANKENKPGNNLKDMVVQKIYPEWKNYDVVIGEPQDVSGIKIIKSIKKGKMALLRNPKALISKKGRTIRWQFDMYHGVGNLDKAIELLPDKDRKDFNYYVNNENCFSKGNMFITKSSNIMNSYFEDVFNWLFKCEKIFGFDLEGYGSKRIYGFLAERYLSFWFKKYTKYIEWPVIFYDINK